MPEPFADAVETFTKRKSRWPQRPVGRFDVAAKVYAGESRKFNEADWVRNGGRFADFVGRRGGSSGGAGAAEESAKKAGTTLAEWHVDKHPDTQKLYQKDPPNGPWSPDRKAIHDAMVADVTKGIPVRPEGERTFYVLGGGGGSGKTYLVNNGKLPVPKAEDRQAVLVNADDAKARLPEYKGMQDAGNTAQAARIVHEESSYMTKGQMQAGWDNGQDVVLDGVGDGSVSGLRSKADGAKAKGYSVKGYYVATDVGTAVAAAKKRAVTKGDPSYGRVVPEARLRGDHRSVSKILPKAIDDGVFDEVEIWDNKFDGNPTKVFSAKKNADGTMTKTVHDEAGYQRFLDKGNQTLHLSEIRQTAQDIRAEQARAAAAAGKTFDLTILLTDNGSGGTGERRKVKVKVDKDGYTDIPARDIDPEDDQKIYMAAFGEKFPTDVPDNDETRDLFAVYQDAIKEAAKDGVVATTAED